MFGKRYNNCVKKKATKEEVEFQEGSYQDFEDRTNIKAVKPKKPVELPKTPERKPENKDTFKSGNEVGKENVRKGIARNAEVTTVTRSQNKKMKNVTPMGDLIKNRLMDEYAPVTEGVAFLKRKKEEKKKSKSEYLTKRDAGRVARRKMEEKDQKTVNFLEPAYESKTRLVKNGHTYKVVLTWRGKTYMVQMFVPSVSRPTRQQIEKEVQKLYPDAKVMSFLPRDLEPGEPTVMMGEGKADKLLPSSGQRSEVRDKRDFPHGEGDMGRENRIAAHKERRGKKVKPNFDRSQDPSDFALMKSKSPSKSLPGRANLIDRAERKGLVGLVKKLENQFNPDGEENIQEDDMKGMSVSSGHKRPTKSGAGMTAKGVAAYRRRNPGSKLKTAVTGKVKKGSKDANRRKSYCARSAGQMKKFPKAAKDPNSRLRQARRRWKC